MNFRPCICRIGIYIYLLSDKIHENLQINEILKKINQLYHYFIDWYTSCFVYDADSSWIGYILYIIQFPGYAAVESGFAIHVVNQKWNF